jgi:hypothetical protein
VFGLKGNQPYLHDSQRYFVMSILTGALTRDEKLALVRLHWGIENGCLWTLDVVLGEDDGDPWKLPRARNPGFRWRTHSAQSG